jgi:hypothetical protein
MKVYIDYELVAWLTDTLPLYEYVIRNKKGNIIASHENENDAMDMAQRQGYNDFEEYKRPVLVQKFDSINKHARRLADDKPVQCNPLVGDML